MTQADVATELGVSHQTITNWEKGITDPGARHFRGLALILGCSVAQLLNGRTPPSRLLEWVARWGEEQPLYGTVQLRFAGGDSYDYPLSDRARGELLYTLNSRAGVPWVGFDVHDGRLVFLNAAELESLTLTPGVARSKPKQEAVLVTTTDGKERALAQNDETFQLLDQLLTIAEEPESVVDVEAMNDWVVCLGKGEDDELLYYRLGALRLIEVPLGSYRERISRALTGA